MASRSKQVNMEMMMFEVWPGSRYCMPPMRCRHLSYLSNVYLFLHPHTGSEAGDVCTIDNHLLQQASSVSVSMLHACPVLTLYQGYQGCH